jgi:hypothetical protein
MQREKAKIFGMASELAETRDFRHIFISRAKSRHKVQNKWNSYRKAIKLRKSLV